MRPLDPRLWNLLPATAMFTVACGPGGIPTDDNFGDAGDVSDVADDVDVADEIGPECKVDTDCSQGYYCLEELCKPVTYSDYSDYSDYADWDTSYTSYTSYTTYTDWDTYTDYSDYSDSPWYECYSDYDCPPEYVCTYNYCSPKPPDPPDMQEPAECEGPALMEIPLPNLGTVVDLQMADIDGDGDDEIVALLVDGVAVIQDDDSVVITPWSMPPPIPLRQLAVLALDADGNNDLVAFPDIAGSASVALGDGLGNFNLVGELPNPPVVEQLMGFDGELDGVDRLLAIRPIQDRMTQFSNPLLLSGNNTMIGPVGATDLELLQFESALAPDVLIGVACAASVRTGPAFAAVTFLTDPMLGAGICGWEAAAFIDGAPDQPLLIFTQANLSILRRYDLPADMAFQIMVPFSPTSTSVANLDGSGDFVLLTDPGEGRVVWGWTDDDPGCIATLPFVGTLEFAIGDRNGDGTQDVATLDDLGMIRLWSGQ